MKALAVQKRTVAVMENGTWAPTSGKDRLKEKISEMKDMTILDTGLTIKSAMHADQKGRAGCTGGCDCEQYGIK